MHRSIPTALLFILLTGCSQIETEQIPVPIFFNAGYSLSVDVTTRAPIYDIDQMEPIQILRSDGTANYSSHTAPDLTGTVAADGTVTPSVPQYYDLGGDQANFMAFYPAARSIQGGIANFKITGQEDITAAQVVYGGSIESPKTVTLAFRHLLAQVRVMVSAENAQTASAWGPITYIKVQIPTSLVMDTNTWPALSPHTDPETDYLPTSIGDNASQTITTTYASAGSLMILTAAYPIALKVKTANKEETTVTTSIWYVGPQNVYTIRLYFKDSFIEVQ